MSTAACVNSGLHYRGQRRKKKRKENWLHKDASMPSCPSEILVCDEMGCSAGRRVKANVWNLFFQVKSRHVVECDPGDIFKA